MGRVLHDAFEGGVSDLTLYPMHSLRTLSATDLCNIQLHERSFNIELFEAQEEKICEMLNFLFYALLVLIQTAVTIGGIMVLRTSSGAHSTASHAHHPAKATSRRRDVYRFMKTATPAAIPATPRPTVCITAASSPSPPSSFSSSLTMLLAEAMASPKAPVRLASASEAWAATSPEAVAMTLLAEALASSKCWVKEARISDQFSLPWERMSSTKPSMSSRALSNASPKPLPMSSPMFWMSSPMLSTVSLISSPMSWVWKEGGVSIMIEEV